LPENQGGGRKEKGRGVGPTVHLRGTVIAKQDSLGKWTEVEEKSPGTEEKKRMFSVRHINCANRRNPERKRCLTREKGNVQGEKNE